MFAAHTAPLHRLQDEPDRLTNPDGGAVRSAARNGSRRGDRPSRSNGNGNGQHRPVATGGPLAVATAFQVCVTPSKVMPGGSVSVTTALCAGVSELL